MTNQSISNVLTHLQVYNIHTVPGFWIVEHQYLIISKMSRHVGEFVNFICLLLQYSVIDSNLTEQF